MIVVRFVYSAVESVQRKSRSTKIWDDTGETRSRATPKITERLCCSSHRAEQFYIEYIQRTVAVPYSVKPSALPMLPAAALTTNEIVSAGCREHIIWLYMHVRGASYSMYRHILYI